MVPIFDKGASLIFFRARPFSKFCVAFWILFFCTEAWAGPADVSLHHWSYEAVERLAAMGFCNGLGLGMRPLTREMMATKVSEALKTVEEKELDLSHDLAYRIEEDLLRLSYEFAPELEQLGVSSLEDEERRVGQPFHWKRFMFQTGLVSEKIVTDLERSTSSSLIENSQGFRLQDGLNGRWRLPSWVSLGDWLAVTVDPSLRVREENSDADLDFEEISVKGIYRNFELKAGKLNFWWGPGTHGDLLLTNNTRPLRAFSLRTRRPFRLPWKLKVLGNWQAQLIGAQLDEKRTVQEPFLTGTRFEWSPFEQIVMSVSHLALFGGKGEKETISDFFNALDPTEGGGEEERANHLFGGDIRIFLPELIRWTRLGSGLELYGEFFGEDTKGIYIPNLVSYLGGFLITDLFSWPGFDFRFEGVTTDPLAYEHFVYTSGYRFKNEFIGHHVGEDADDLFFRLTQAFFIQEKRWVAGIQFDRERRGVSGETLSFGRTAQTKNEVQIDLAHEFSKQLEFSVAYQFEDINNFQGSSGVEATNHIVILKTQFHF